MGNIVVARVYAADKPLQKFIAANIVNACINKAGLIGNIIGKLTLFLDTDNVAGLLVDCLAHEFN